MLRRLQGARTRRYESDYGRGILGAGKHPFACMYPVKRIQQLAM